MRNQACAAALAVLCAVGYGATTSTYTWSDEVSNLRWSYTVVTNTVTISSFTRLDTTKAYPSDIVVPAEIANVPVRTVNFNGLSSIRNLNTLTIRDGVERVIVPYYCSTVVTNLYLPASVKRMEGLFYASSSYYPIPLPSHRGIVSPHRVS